MCFLGVKIRQSRAENGAISNDRRWVGFDSNEFQLVL